MINPIILVRTLIVTTYIALFAPSVIFYFTHFWLFGILAVIYILAALCLLPKAKRDWYLNA